MVALGTVYAEAHQLLLPLSTRDIAKSVAIGKGGGASHHDVVATYLLDKAHALAHTLGSDGVAQVGGSLVHEVIGETAIETPFRVWGKGQFHPALRGGTILLADTCPRGEGVEPSRTSRATKG